MKYFLCLFLLGSCGPKHKIKNFPMDSGKTVYVIRHNVDAFYCEAGKGFELEKKPKVVRCGTETGFGFIYSKIKKTVYVNTFFYGSRAKELCDRALMLYLQSQSEFQTNEFFMRFMDPYCPEVGNVLRKELK